METSAIRSTNEGRYSTWADVDFDISNFYEMPEGSKIRSFNLEYVEGDVIHLNLTYHYKGNEISGSVAVSKFDISFQHEHVDVVNARYDKMVEDNGGTYPQGLIGSYKTPFQTDFKIIELHKEECYDSNDNKESKES